MELLVRVHADGDLWLGGSRDGGLHCGPCYDRDTGWVKDVNLDLGEIIVHDNRVVVAGQVRDKVGGKTHNADKTILIDGTTLAALEKWRRAQNHEREFLVPTTTGAIT